MEEARPSSDGGSVRPDETIVLLRSTPLLQDLPEDTLKRISEALRPVKFGAGEPIVRLNREGDGDGSFYIIWTGEAEVRSPDNGHRFGHKESRLSHGDYFGIIAPLRQRRYKVDVVAINEVLCLVLAYENADLLSAASVWDWDSKYERRLNIEQILQLEAVESVGDMKMRSPRFRNHYYPFHYLLQGTVSRFKVTNNYFGGQLVAQALLAATKSVRPEQLVHSLNSYFIRTASPEFDVVFEVERVRDGRSYATRQVKAMQNDRLVFVLSASFKREEDSFEHSYPLPKNVPGPEEAIPIERLLDDHLCDPRLPLVEKKKFAGVKFPLVPIEMRYVDPYDKFQPAKLEPSQQVWIRSRVKISEEDQNFHRCVGAYASDLPLLGTSTLPHPETIGSRLNIMSLDHTMWFHRSFNAHEWLLFSMESPICADGRGLTLGRFYTQDGKLVMSVAQEGVVRILQPAKL